ncbi:aminobutyraldehyde dehydrogenase [Mycolicibacterium austroafricanum]|uniref:Aminobutyraldehyde dehydrogenase n=1 Tax=Mycolicibacterium austroafricanum TaxID=39687 RepID=A0ABT8HAI8_MYCAO|nr:aminobutyraldehyde dehydrogenase [Mycolicibacterium austroafricanum]MDN4517744.1 aminobutyraldehyde dehydrogenase [Mycolicibacterium austroafricanum]QRZ08867.1 aminobutyraldehyde dehydrogenase [Mycolicibacterium austroafricanum]QZT70642.1 aminobutyraldehyde dehydrogenase [Mycolicibacterium austroafricanum]
MTQTHTELRHFVAGASTLGAGSHSEPVINPATGEAIASVRYGTAADVDDAVAAALAAFATWRHTTPKERADILLRCAAVVEEHGEELARLESADTGKPVSAARDDVAATVDTLQFMAGAIRAQQSLASGSYVADHTSTILREPVGVVAAITPWNYPLLIAAQKIGPILAAGNTCVMKPSEHTPVTTVRLAELLAEHLPAGVLNVVNGDGAIVGAALATHPDVALVSVTGSVRSGQAVAQAAAASLKRLHLELGGKAPVLVFGDADLEAVADGVAMAAFANSGQDCGAACRVLVDESVSDQLVERLVLRVEALAVGDPADGDHIEMGPLITEAQYHRVLGFLDRALAQGIRAVTGGTKLDRPGFFIAPTVLVDIPDNAECIREEIFGPVVTVQAFSSEAAMIEAANGTAYGLSASIWTEDARRAADLPKHLDFGTVWVNDHLVMPAETPWGGFKSSGYGRDMSLYALDDYSRTKHVMVNHAPRNASE